MAINARSVFFGCKYAAAQMLEQEPHSSGDRGWIINIASIAALIGLPSAVSYSASKGSVTSMTRTISLEYAADRIHVNAICPGCESFSFSVFSLLASSALLVNILQAHRSLHLTNTM